MKEIKTELNEEYEKLYKNLINFLGSVFNNQKFCARFSSSYNETLHQYFVDLLSYEAYLEKKVENKNNLSLYFQKMLQILCNRKAEFSVVANVALDDIYVQLNLIKTYLLNIYKMNFKQELCIFDQSTIKNLLNQVKKCKKSTISQSTDDFKDKFTNDSLNKKQINDKELKSGFSAILQNIIKQQQMGANKAQSVTNNQIKKNILGVTDSFYPYQSRPQVIVWLKWVLYTLCAFLLGFSVVMSFVSLFAGDYWNAIIFFISIFPLSRYYLIFRRDITNKKLLRCRYTFHFLMFVSISFTVILLGIISWSTFGFHFQNEVFSHPTQYSILSFIYGTVAMLTWVVALLTYILNPKIDREKIKEAQNDLLSSFKQNLSN